MSKKYPVVVVTGSSGAGTSTVKEAFGHVFRREGILPAVVEGDSFHRYNRAEMKKMTAEAELEGCRRFSHFGPEANLFQELEDLLRTYGESGRGKRRLYIHNEEEAEAYRHLGIGPGQFTPWEEIPEGTDLLFYEGLHGCVVDKANGVNV
ncbi:MAG: phosphoribulokinase, partial [Alphaproteobacteria bacterium]|nr:phosphoribulokinase [Alphaproteobacteria bacterium]